MTAKSVLDREFLEMRCRLMDLAASFDRIDRGSDAGTATADPRMERLRKGAAILTSGCPGRAEKMQMLFSDDHKPGWRTEFGLA